MATRTARSGSTQCNSCSRHRIGRVATLLSCLALGRASVLTGNHGRGRHPGAFVQSLRPVGSTRPVPSFTPHNRLQVLQPSQRSVGGIRSTRRKGQAAMVDVGMAVYDLQLWAKEVVDMQLTHLTPVSGAILYGAGLLTSLSPCALSLLPLTMAYLTDDGTDPERSRGTLFFRASMFTVGLSLSLSVLGLSATLAGRLFGTVGGAGVVGALLPFSASIVAVLMGLNLLELIRLELPSLDSTLPLDKLPPSAQAFLLGASSALIASPCSTPVLASILGFVATSTEPYLGVGLLFAYSLGYSTPLLLAGVLSGTVTSFIRSKGDQFSWVTPATAAVLITYGTYSGLNTLFPPAY